jgi:hypothetical protein
MALLMELVLFAQLARHRPELKPSVPPAQQDAQLAQQLMEQYHALFV